MAMAEKSAAHLEKVARSAASQTNVRTAESPAPEASRQTGQFGPLPSVIRPSPQAERKVRDGRRGTGNFKGRTFVLYWLTGTFLGVVLMWVLAGALAQQSPKPAASQPGKNAPPPQQQQPQQQQQAQQQPAMPVSTEQALYLIRSTLLTLNDANRSGNYTVLRDLAAPDFQVRNTAADLSQSFSDLRRRNFDLYGAALLSPQLTALPALDQRGFLRLAGYFPTRPQHINFDLLFANVANQWRLFGISIATPDAPAAGK